MGGRLKAVGAGLGTAVFFVGLYAANDNLIDSQRKYRISSKKCRPFLECYVSCMEKHQHQAPAPYELEWCVEEKDAYGDCMNELLIEFKGTTTTGDT